MKPTARWRLLLNRGYEVRTSNHPPGAAGRRELWRARADFPYDFDRPDELLRTHGRCHLIDTIGFPTRKDELNWVRIRGFSSRRRMPACGSAVISRILPSNLPDTVKAKLADSVMTSGLSWPCGRRHLRRGRHSINNTWFVGIFQYWNSGEWRYRIRPIMPRTWRNCWWNQSGRGFGEGAGPRRSLRGTGEADCTSVDQTHPVHATVLAYLSFYWRGGSKDVVVGEEYRGLMDNLLALGRPATGETR